MVEALLLQFERHGVEAGEEAYDFNRLRRKLGLRTREIQGHTDHRRSGPDLMP